MNYSKHNITFLFTICLLFFQSIVIAQETKNLIQVDESTKQITYLPYTEKGDILPDFSYSGYKGGGVEFSIPKIVKVISPIDGDNTAHIQNAIDEVGKMRRDKNGLRGTLLLSAGTYNVAKTIYINDSGVTLMGVAEKNSKTLLVATSKKKYTLLKIGQKESPKVDKRSKRKVVADYVPSGTKKLLLDKASRFKVGDAIIVERPSTAAWISAIGMDKIENSWRSTEKLSSDDMNKYRKNGALNEDESEYNTTVQWKPGSKNLKFERVITAINGNEITINIPLTNALQKEFGGGFVYKYSLKKRLNEVGILNIAFTTLYNKKKTYKDKMFGEYLSDENHGWTAVEFVNAENSWAKNVEITHFAFGFKCNKYSRFITIRNSKVLDPISKIAGGRRYAYSINGQQCLVYNNYSRGHRHDYVMGAIVAGPNAFVNNVAEMCYAASEPHQRWATGTLFENSSVSGPSSYFSLSNRGRYGSGHGWSGAQMVLWNVKAPIAVVMKPPTAQNFSFGTKTLKDEWSNPESLQFRINKLNQVAGKDFQYNNEPVVGDGYIFKNDEEVLPKSLYFSQLEARKKNKK